MPIDLNKLTDDELREITKQAERLLSEREKERKRVVMEEVKARLATEGLTLRDLARAGRSQRKADRTVQPMVNPDDPTQTWTPGRGRRPKWATRDHKPKA